MNEGFLCVYQAYDYVIASGFKKLGSREERDPPHKIRGQYFANKWKISGLYIIHFLILLFSSSTAFN